MPTSFAVTQMVMLVTLNSLGELAPVPQNELPPGITSPLMFTQENCNFIRGKFADPTKYTCQKFVSPKETRWTKETGAAEALPVEPAKVQPQLRNAPSEPPKSDDRGDIDPKMFDGIGDPNKAAPAEQQKPIGNAATQPKRLSEHSGQRVREAEGDAAKQPMFSGNPFRTVFNW
jgi:hypothetical protein